LNELISTIEKTLGKPAILNYLSKQPGDTDVSLASNKKERTQTEYNSKYE
jgi:hypothetical protein